MLAGTVLLRAQPAPPAPPGGVAVTKVQAPAAPATNTLGPRIQFATKDPDFGRVRKGEVVKYTYTFTNTGDAVLNVLNVQPGCGCTRAGEWTKVVKPGQSGSIPIQLATANFQGNVTKFVTVTCDDKSIPNGTIQLQLKGNIWTPIEVSPQFMNFTVPADGVSGSGTVTITNHTEEPLYLSEPHSSNPAFSAELKTNTPGRGYQLVISRLPPLTPGVLQAQITVKTSWPDPASLPVTVWANVQAPVTILPMQLTLAQAPLSNPAPYTITIQNSTTNHMVLSEPAVSAKDVKVELRELQPGRYFNALLTFPPGFEIPPGEHAAFTVKSSLAKYPVISVPIMQLPRPVPRPPAIAPRPVALPRVLPAPPPPRADAR